MKSGLKKDGLDDIRVALIIISIQITLATMILLTR